MSVYVIVNPEASVVKFGKSSDPTQRLRALQTGNHQKLELLCLVSSQGNDDGMTETRLHYQFKDHLVLGEWFSVPLEGIKMELESRGFTVDEVKGGDP